MGFYLLSAVLVIGYPITRARHAQLRAQLAARDTATDKLGRLA
jgi:Na+/melibiose symporter-like transporter